MSARSRSKPWFRNPRGAPRLEEMIAVESEHLAAEDLERRLWCREAGHDVAHSDHQPVLSMFVCLRCGRFARTREELEAMR